MRVKFADLFDVDANGNCTAKHDVRIEVNGGAYKGSQGSTAAFSALYMGNPPFPLGDIVGNDLEVDDQSGVKVVTGYYPTSGNQLQRLS